jgi:hypothetical protein
MQTLFLECDFKDDLLEKKRITGTILLEHNGRKTLHTLFIYRF